MKSPGFSNWTTGKSVVNTFRINSRGTVQNMCQNYVFFYCWYYSDLSGSNRRLIKMYISNVHVIIVYFDKNVL